MRRRQLASGLTRLYNDVRYSGACSRRRIAGLRRRESGGPLRLFPQGKWKRRAARVFDRGLSYTAASQKLRTSETAISTSRSQLTHYIR